MSSQEINKELESIIFEYGHVMYRLGRMETDGLDSTQKEYTKTLRRKEELLKIIPELIRN